MALFHRSRPMERQQLSRQRDFSSDTDSEPSFVALARSRPTATNATAHIFDNNQRTQRNSFLAGGGKSPFLSGARNKVRRGKKRQDHFDASCGTGGRYASSDGEIENCDRFFDALANDGANSGGIGRTAGIFRRSTSATVLRRKPISNTDGNDNNSVNINTGGNGSGGNNNNNGDEEEEVPPFWTRVWSALFPEENDPSAYTFFFSIFKGLVLIVMYLIFTCYACPRIIYYIFYMLGLED